MGSVLSEIIPFAVLVTWLLWTARKKRKDEAHAIRIKRLRQRQREWYKYCEAEREKMSRMEAVQSMQTSKKKLKGVVYCYGPHREALFLEWTGGKCRAYNATFNGVEGEAEVKQ